MLFEATRLPNYLAVVSHLPLAMPRTYSHLSQTSSTAPQRACDVHLHTRAAHLILLFGSGGRGGFWRLGEGWVRTPLIFGASWVSGMQVRFSWRMGSRAGEWRGVHVDASGG